MTQVLELDPERPQQEAIELAASIIRKGGLVAFPTETVYGLGADAMNENAVRKIFEAKGRPADNPCIVHVDSRDMLDRVAGRVGDRAESLIQKFWPGPLTLVLERKPEVAPSVSAGLSTVAVRMPGNGIALRLIRASRTPIAAPSANASGRPSPTTAAHVLDDLGGRIDLILDGGTTNIGIESTVLDVTAEPPMILRPGWITQEMLSEAIGPVERSGSDEELRRSPGTHHRHYSPRARVILIEQGSAELLERVCREHLKTGSVGFAGHSFVEIDNPNFCALRLGSSAKDYAHSMYAMLRQLDKNNPRVIIVEGISEAGEGAAVMDRLRRAASEGR
ncbi:MAG TPA: L-threonylcarbamoyladenylate synthase [Blastocatellia bacterium]|nr:L-threonylcarbamoyladenylate synthase [Blastocatellia bacterium]